MSQFPLQVKSTIDFIASGLANAHGYEYFDLDSSAWETSLVQSQQPAMAWAFSNMAEHPRDPLWLVGFDIGAKVSEDPAQYTSLEITSVILSQFATGQTVPIMDYSGATPPTTPIGTLIITSAHAIPAQFDRTSGLRLVRVEAKAIRFS